MWYAVSTSFHKSKVLTSIQSTNGKLIVLKRLLQHTFLLHLIFGEFKAISESLRLPIIFAFKMGIKINLMPSNFYDKLGMNKNDMACLLLIMEVITTETSMVTTSVEDRVLLSLLQMQQGRREVYTLGDNFHLQPIDSLTVLSNSSTAFKNV